MEEDQKFKTLDDIKSSFSEAKNIDNRDIVDLTTHGVLQEQIPECRSFVDSVLAKSPNHETAISTVLRIMEIPASVSSHEIPRIRQRLNFIAAFNKKPKDTSSVYYAFADSL